MGGFLVASFTEHRWPVTPVTSWAPRARRPQELPYPSGAPSRITLTAHARAARGVRIAPGSPLTWVFHDPGCISHLIRLPRWVKLDFPDAFRHVYAGAWPDTRD